MKQHPRWAHRANTTTFTVNQPPTAESTVEIVYVIYAVAGSGRTSSPPSGVTSYHKWTSGNTKTTEVFTANSVDGTEDGGTSTSGSTPARQPSDAEHEMSCPLCVRFGDDD